MTADRMIIYLVGKFQAHTIAQRQQLKVNIKLWVKTFGNKKPRRPAGWVNKDDQEHPKMKHTESKFTDCTRAKSSCKKCTTCF